MFMGFGATASDFIDAARCDTPVTKPRPTLLPASADNFRKVRLSVVMSKRHLSSVYTKISAGLCVFAVNDEKDSPQRGRQRRVGTENFRLRHYFLQANHASPKRVQRYRISSPECFAPTVDLCTRGCRLESKRSRQPRW